MPVNKVRLLIVDDHEIVREGLLAVLREDSELEVVAQAADGIEACELAAIHQPDVVIMDLSMPRLNGHQATRRLLEAAPACKVIALSVHDEPPYVRELLRAGARGYLLKRAAVPNLLHAVRLVAGGGLYLDPQLAHRSPPDTAVRPAPSHGELSSREIEVASMTARGHTIAEIAAALTISGKTVETHRTRLMVKLGLKTRAELVRYAVYSGWLSA